MEAIKLTQYAHGAGCGCKISTSQLEQILSTKANKTSSPFLLVGHTTKDDAAVYALRDNTCVMSTVDFFTPIVDDPFSYGAIASANALSDIYAMGGTPLMAVAILGWPVDKIPLKLAKKVLLGSQSLCSQADIPVAGGHSIDTLEPIFGLAVTGTISKKNIKTNHRANIDSTLYLTKPLGTGIITTAQKHNRAKKTHLQKAINTMLTLNQYGSQWGKLSYINAMTDVTGFGLLGHLIEICEASHLSAEIELDKIPVFEFLDQYLHPDNIPGGTHRNLTSYAHKVAMRGEEKKWILADPQTSGGLLVSVDKESAAAFEYAAQRHKLTLKPFGRLIKRQTKSIIVK